MENHILVSHSNRGMSLEEDINATNQYYLEHDIAVIYKKPIPIQIVKVDYANRSKTVIKEAYYKVPSTTDYNGLYKGRYIDFEAKETKSKTSFPLNNIHEHQINHLSKICKHGGIGFLIVRFSLHNKTFLYQAELLEKWIESDRKSIPYIDFLENGYELKESLHPRLDYLEAVQKIYF